MIENAVTPLLTLWRYCNIALIIMVTVVDEAYAWLAVVAVPINSVVNPLLYSLTTRPFCHQLQSSIRKRRRSSQESLRDTLGKDWPKT